MLDLMRDTVTILRSEQLPIRPSDHPSDEDRAPDLASELAAWDAASDEALASFESSLE